MFNSTVLETAIGLVFVFAAVALMVSSINEAVASMLKLRGKLLLTGIKQLLNDTQFNGLAHELYNHALVNPLSNGTSAPGVDPAMKPSYIPSRDFANALIDRLQQTPTGLLAGINAIPDPQLRALLSGFAARADQNIDQFGQQVADWFDSAMNRVSGNYKRRSQVITFGIAFVVALTLQIDSVHLCKALWAHPAYMARIAIAAPPASGPDSISGVITQVDELPLGYEGEDLRTRYPPWSARWLLGTLMPLPGLFITATAALFGAPFWFDLLQQLIQLRGSGAKPPTDRDRGKTTAAATP